MAKPDTPGRVKPLEDKTPTGRPRKIAPSDAVEVVKHACATGASKVGVAMALGVSHDVLTRWMDEDPALKEAFLHGREIERKTLHNVLYESAVGADGKNSLIASMFLLKSRHNYLEGQQESQSNKVSITFNLPGALQPEQFTIENHDRNSADIALPRTSIKRS